MKKPRVPKWETYINIISHKHAVFHHRKTQTIEEKKNHHLPEREAELQMLRMENEMKMCKNQVRFISNQA